MIDELDAAGSGLQLTSDVCIIGSGAAGLALAADLQGSGLQVVLLESGRHTRDEFADALNEAVTNGVRHDGARSGRVRAFGGTTSAWGGQLLPLRASELAARPWVPRSGWPLSGSALEPWYRRAEALFAVDEGPYDAGAWSRVGIAPPALDPERYCVRFSKWAPLGRRNLAVLLRRRLAAARDIRVFLDATAIRLDCRPGGRQLEQVEARSRGGARLTVKARTYVLACGGIETPRLLLASPGSTGSGVANGSGQVGRYFQDHISFTAAEIVPRSRRELQRLFDPRYLGQTMLTVKIEPSDQFQAQERLLNAMGHIAFQIPDALGMLELKRLMRSVQAGRMPIPSSDELMALLRGSGELVRLLALRVRDRRRASPRAGAVRLMIDVEQAPDPESRITLAEERDAFGVPRAVVGWRLGELEGRTLDVYSRSLAAEFERLGLGSVTRFGAPDFTLRDQPRAARDIYHHMGTARMSASPAAGVTDSELRCHEVDNLFIAGSAVFPSSGIANPTFTIVALALRLGEHLRRTLR